MIINISLLPSVRGFIYTARRGGRSKYKSLFDLFLMNFIASEILRYLTLNHIKHIVCILF